jgi:hypothetical protein
MAHKVGRPSIALAQAIQFELKALGQKDVIGEWVRQSDPGASDIVTEDGKWLRGFRWSQIDSDLILRHTILTRQGKTKVKIKVNLTRKPMVMDELTKLGERPANGPMIVCENSSIPWTAYEFRRQWRKVATAAGVPKTVFNMDSRERRTPAYTEPSDAEGSDEPRSDEDVRILMQKVKASLPNLLPDQVRDDVVQDVMLDLHSGKISEADLSAKLSSRYISPHYKRYNNQFSTISLDQPIPGTDNQTLGDRISSQHDVWR